MKINRSSKIYFNKWITAAKQQQINSFIKEYARIVNLFIEGYEEIIPETKKFDLMIANHIQPMITKSETWLSARAVKNAFSEGYGMVKSAKSNAISMKTKYYRPKHYGKKAILNENNNIQSEEVKTVDFDFNVILGSIGNKLKITIPLKKHKQFNKWNELGKRAKSIVLTSKYIQFSFEIETGKKKTPDGQYLGIDIGIAALAATSDNEFYGLELTKKLEELQRKKKCSKGYYRKKQEIKEYINYTIKQLPMDQVSLVVVEKLKNLKYKMKDKRRLSKNIRRVISNWSYRQILDRIQAIAEENRVSFRSVAPFYTSQECSICGHTDKKNRLSQSEFVCLECGHSSNADYNASKVILNRFITGPYGACYKPLHF